MPFFDVVLAVIVISGGPVIACGLILYHVAAKRA